MEQVQRLAVAKIECEFHLASACSQSQKLTFALSGLSREEFEYRQSLSFYIS
jgi:hypothetical protein